MTGELQLSLGNEAEAHTELRDSMMLLEASENRGCVPLEIKVLGLLGELALRQRRLDEATSVCEAAQRRAERWLESHPKNRNAQRQLAVCARSLSVAQRASGDFTAAVDSCQRAIGGFQHLLIADPDSLDYRRELVASHEQLGDTLRLQRSRTEAVDAYRRAAIVGKPLAAASKQSNRGRHVLLGIYAKIVHLQIGRSSELLEARKFTERSCRVAEKCLAIDGTDTVAADALVDALSYAAQIEVQLARPKNAINQLQRAHAFLNSNMAARSSASQLERLARIDDAIERLSPMQ